MLTWFPLMMAGAAVVTLAAALLFALLHTLAGWVQRVFIWVAEKWFWPLSALGRWVAVAVDRGYRAFRVLAAVAGVGLIIAAMVYIWMNVAVCMLTRNGEYVLGRWRWASGCPRARRTTRTTARRAVARLRRWSRVREWLRRNRRRRATGTRWCRRHRRRTC